MDMSKYISQVANGLTHSAIDTIFEKASKMEGVVNLAMGQPDFNTPEEASRAGIRAIEEHLTKYTEDQGIPELRQEISKFIKKKYNLDYSWEKEIIVFAGVNNAMDTVFRTIINPGDEILVQQPNYSTYVPSILLSGGKIVPVDTYMEEGFRLDGGRLKAAVTSRTKALIISYPNNPTGAVMSREDFMKIRDVVEDTGILVISDEIYSEMVYEGGFTSFASLPGMKGKTITLNGFSKTFSMPGWRVGYACATADMVDALLRVHQNTVMNVPSISQYAAVEAMRSSDVYVANMLRVYDERRRYVVGRLKDMGIKCFVPGGAYFVFPSIKDTGLNSRDFCSSLLEEEKVALVPGVEFGSCGEGYVRLSYTTSLNNLKEGLDRVEIFLNKYS